MSEEGMVALLVGASAFGISTGILEAIANINDWENRSVPATLYLAAVSFAALCGGAAYGFAKLFASINGG